MVMNRSTCPLAHEPLLSQLEIEPEFQHTQESDGVPTVMLVQFEGNAFTTAFFIPVMSVGNDMAYWPPARSAC